MRGLLKSVIVGFIFLEIGLFVFAEKIVFESSLVWRTDDKGDYLIPVDLPSDIYEAKEVVSTEGEVTSVVATAKFKGKVELEISADAGAHYTPIVFGVPLKEGFVKGNRLRWRAKIFPHSKLEEVKIVYTDSASTITSFGNPYLSGFKFRKAIHIKNPNQKDLFNYQVNIKVGESRKAKNYDVQCEGKLEKDFIDIRFIAEDGQTSLSFYREKIEGSKPQRLASFWVKIPQIPKEGITIYLYYGNANTEDLSNPEAVFDFFDDFEDKQLNKWKRETQELVELDAKLTNSQFILKRGELVPRAFKFSHGIIEYLAKNEKKGGISLSIKGEKNYTFYSSPYKGAEHCIAIDEIVKKNVSRAIDSARFYHFRILANEKEIRFERYLDDFKKKDAIVYLDSSSFFEGYISLNTINSDKEGSIYYDWIRVRKYSKYLPKVVGERKEERVSLPLFKNVTLDSKGNIVLVEGRERGEYVSGKVFSKFRVRIASLDWKEKGGRISFDFSADRGDNYKLTCEKQKFYYASKRDFYPGSILVYRARLYLEESSEGTASRQKQGLPEVADGKVSPSLEEIILDYRPGKIVVVYPNGGEEVKEGEEIEILWSAMDYEEDYPMNIYYILEDKEHLIAQNVKNKGRFLWNPPFISSEKVKIKIVDGLDKRIYDASDFYFSLK